MRSSGLALGVRGYPVTGLVGLWRACRLELGFVGGHDPLQASETMSDFRDRTRAFIRNPKGLRQLILLGRQMHSLWF